MENATLSSGHGLLTRSSSLLGYSAGTVSNGTSTTGLSTPTVGWQAVNYPPIDPAYLNNTLSGGFSFNIKSTQNMQSKLVVFKVKRDEKGNVISSEFIKEFWVEKLPNVSIELLAVKELDPGFDPKDIVVKEILTAHL